MQGGPPPGSVRFGYGLGMERFKRFWFSVLAVPLQKGLSVFQHGLTEKTTGHCLLFGQFLFLHPVLPFLVFLEFLVFFSCEEFLFFLSVFPFFSRDFRGSAGIKNPCFWGWFSLPSNPKNLLRLFFGNNLARQKITSKNKTTSRGNFCACFRGYFSRGFKNNLTKLN